MIKRILAPLAVVAATGLAGQALAAGEGGHVTDVDFSFEGPFGTYDSMQLQRGFQVFHQVCASCHGLKYLAFRSLGDSTGPAFPDDQVKAIAALYEVADTGPEALPGDTRPGLPSDKFPANTAAGAPDLSLMAKARAGFHGPYGLGINQFLKGTGGAEYIYSLLTGYTGEEHEAAGSILYGNEVFPGGKISMAQPLWGDDVEYTVHGGGDHEGEEGYHGADYTPPEATIEQEAKDVAAFLMWVAEPKLTERKEAGLRNLIWLVILSVLLYFTNKKVWASVKGDH
ncbi:cytochrome c1 [Paralimibaculum aggregatum]|nr:cytochrome c1 [Limibaculum sp. NKW23]